VGVRELVAGVPPPPVPGRRVGLGDRLVQPADPNRVVRSVAVPVATKHLPVDPEVVTFHVCDELARSVDSRDAPRHSRLNVQPVRTKKGGGVVDSMREMMIAIAIVSERQEVMPGLLPRRNPKALRESSLITRFEYLERSLGLCFDWLQLNPGGSLDVRRVPLGDVPRVLDYAAKSAKRKGSLRDELILLPFADAPDRSRLG
jgi:hypothetical protein